MNQERYILVLHRRLNLTAPRWHKLSSYFSNNWEAAYKAKIKDWQLTGVEPSAIEKFFGTKEKFTPEQELEALQKCEAQLLTLDSADYPRAWQNLPQAPAVFFARGNTDLLNNKSISVVGSRKITDYGHRSLKNLLKPVFEKQITVVSGLAFGVDAAAHQLALDCIAPTIAVLGNGIDEICPKSNQALANKILSSNGLIISEYLPKTETRPEYFPQRNRLVAGLSQAVVIIEGAAKSGSLITARLANDCGREVWAVPGDIFRTNSVGTNHLISRGEAAPLLGSEQLLESLRLSTVNKAKLPDLSAAEAELLKVLGSQNEWELDTFLSQFPEVAANLNATLTMLELKGLAQKRGNQVFAI